MLVILNAVAYFIYSSSKIKIWSQYADPGLLLGLSFNCKMQLFESTINA